MTAVTGWSNRSSKRISRLVTIPVTRPPSSSTGTPEKFFSRMRATTSPTVAEVETQTGSLMIPLSYFLTALTCSACSAGVMLRWTTPSPPDCARQMAARASVTVSIAAEMSGILSVMLREKALVRSTSCGRTSDRLGTSSTSSKVSARSGCSIDGLYGLTCAR